MKGGLVVDDDQWGKSESERGPTLRAVGQVGTASYIYIRDQ